MIKNWGKWIGRSRRREIGPWWVMGDNLSGVISNRHLRERRKEKGDRFEGMWIGYCRGEMGFASVRGDLRPASTCGVPRLRWREFDLEGGRSMWSGVRPRRCDLGGAGVRRDQCDLGLGWWCDLVRSCSLSLMSLLAHSLSLSLRVSESGNHLKVK